MLAQTASATADRCSSLSRILPSCYADVKNRLIIRLACAMLKHLKRMLTLSNRTRQHSPEVYRALQAAEGYVYLGLYREALRELDTIPASEQEESDVMVARIRILLHLGRWLNAVRLSSRGAAIHKEEDEFTVQHAFALHQLDKGEEAARVLLEAPEWLRKTGILHYNLGCYEARWGNLQIARQCVATAIEINSAIQKNARQDPDLSSLWESKALQPKESNSHS